MPPRVQEQLRHGPPRFSVFRDIDPEGFVAGKALDQETERAVRSATALLALVDRTAFAEDSVYMPEEVLRFQRMGRLIVPVDLEGCLHQARHDAEVRRSLPGSDLTRSMLEVLLNRINVEETSFATGIPSATVVAKLRGSLNSVTRSVQRTRVLVAALFVLIVLAVTAFALFVVSFVLYKRAVARELAANAAYQLGLDPRRSLELSIQSIGVSSTEEGRLALVKAITNARQRFELFGHAGQINYVTFSPTGRQVATSSDDNTIRLWDLENGCCHVLKGHRKRVVAVQFNRDGTRLATAGWDNRAGLWDPSSGRLIKFLEGHNNVVNTVVFSPDSKTLVTAGDRTPHVWNAVTGAFLFELRGHQSNAGPVAFSQDGTWIVTGGWESCARVWNAQTGCLIATVQLPPYSLTSNSVSFVQFSGNGKWLVTTSDGDKITRVWNTSNWKLEHEIDSGGRFAFFNSDNSLLATLGFGGQVHVWNTGDWKRVAILGSHPGVNRVVFSPDGMRIATTSEERIARIWDARSGRLMLELRQPNEPMSSVDFSPDSQLLLTGGTKTAHVWDVSQGTPSATLALTNKQMDGIDRVAASPNGRWLAAAKSDMVSIWDTSNFRQITTLSKAALIKSGVTFSFDSRYLLSSSFALDVWQTGTWTHVAQLKLAEDRGAVYNGAFSRDNTLVAAPSVDDRVTLWQVGTWKPLAVLSTDRSLDSAVFAPDGRSLFVGGAQKALVWQRQAGGDWKTTHDLTPVTQGIYSADFSPDGKHLLTASYAGVLIWDALQWRVVYELRGHNSPVHDARFSPDGLWIVTAGDDGTARVWHSASGEQIFVVDSYTDSVETACFSTDGNSIITGGKDGKVRIYPCEISGADDELVSLAHARSTRVLKCAGIESVK